MTSYDEIFERRRQAAETRRAARGPAPTDCPHCGCNDTTILSEPTTTVGTRDGTARPDLPWTTPGRAQCNHCERSFMWTKAEPREMTRPLVFDVLCPECGSPDTYVASSPLADAESKRKKRYMKCRKCGNNFKTHDKIDEPQLHIRNGEDDGEGRPEVRQRAAG